jgi:MurNAc alpha-1-phosphate uridylyltransferase
MAKPKTITRAMILAAGKGVRMRPLTNDRPKALVEVGGRALIDHALDRLVAVGVKHVVVNVHYYADRLVDHLKRRRDIDLVISDETKEILDTGGGIKKALHHFGNEPFFTHNCDTLWVSGLTNALQRMLTAWEPVSMDCLMLLAATVSSLGYDGRGDFEMADNGLLKRREEQRVAPFVWTGVQIIHPRLFEGSPEGAFSTNMLWDRAIEAERLYGIRLDGTWMHVGTPEGLGEAESFLKEMRRRG